ncbi:Uncharacterised protein [Klebsiella pneumoniae]|nr:Uncharacterised protein [Klebsiella pneumoniae]SLY20206.1 Uncharacterised protein [Klebsiella pneumoniae]
MGFIGKRMAFAPVDLFTVEFNHAHLFWQRIIEHGRQVGPGQSAKMRNHGADAVGINAAGQHGFDIDSEHITFLRAIDHDRSVLWVEKGHF